MKKLTPDAPYVHPDCVITDDCTFGRYVEIGRGSSIAHSSWGDYSYCARYADVANAEIGKFSNIASFTRIGATDHPMSRASQHHFLYRSADYFDDVEHDHAFFEHRRSRRAYIGHDTWLGHASQVRPEVTVGHGAVVASGAIVTKDVAPYTIVAGVPAQPIKRRHSPETAERLMALSWWDWSHDMLRKRLEDFRSMSAEAFLEKYAP